MNDGETWTEHIAPTLDRICIPRHEVSKRDKHSLGVCGACKTPQNPALETDQNARFAGDLAAQLGRYALSDTVNVGEPPKISYQELMRE